MQKTALPFRLSYKQVLYPEDASSLFKGKTQQERINAGQALNVILITVYFSCDDLSLNVF